MKKRKTMLTVLIVLLAVGFAGIATNLVLNGTATIGKNTSEFDVYFSGAILDGVDKSNKFITDKTHLDFLYEAKKTNQKNTLEFEVTNGSKNYDADVSIQCDLKDAEGYVDVNLDAQNFTIRIR